MKSAKKFWYTGSIVVAILIAGGLGFVFLTSPKNTSVDIQPFITYTNSSIDLIVFGCSTPEVNTPCISHVKLSTKLA